MSILMMLAALAFAADAPKASKVQKSDVTTLSVPGIKVVIEHLSTPADNADPYLTFSVNGKVLRLPDAGVEHLYCEDYSADGDLMTVAGRDYLAVELWRDLTVEEGSAEETWTYLIDIRTKNLIQNFQTYGLHQPSDDEGLQTFGELVPSKKGLDVLRLWEPMGQGMGSEMGPMGFGKTTYQVQKDGTLKAVFDKKYCIIPEVADGVAVKTAGFLYAEDEDYYPVLDQVIKAVKDEENAFTSIRNYAGMEIPWEVKRVTKVDIAKTLEHILKKLLAVPEQADLGPVVAMVVSSPIN